MKRHGLTSNRKLLCLQNNIHHNSQQFKVTSINNKNRFQKLIKQINQLFLCDEFILQLTKFYTFLNFQFIKFIFYIIVSFLFQVSWSYTMKSVTIVYKRPNTVQQFGPAKSLKKSVDQYLQKLQQKQKQENHHNNLFTISLRPNLNTAQSSRANRHVDVNQFINVAKIKHSTENIFKQMREHQQSQNYSTSRKKQNKFRSSFVKKTTKQDYYSLKGIKNNQQFFSQHKPNFLTKRTLIVPKQTSKLVSLKKIKFVKQKTVLISVDFILNEFNFWTDQKVQETAHKNWKILQEHSNIVWITRRQNSYRKLLRYSKEHGLRLDGVYKIQPNKRTKTLLFSLSTFQKDFLSESDFIRKQNVKKEIILINSLKVETINNIKYEEFYDLFPVSNPIRSIVHFIQIDMNDKNRFHSPLKILSKQKLPNPNDINYLFSQYYRDHKRRTSNMLRQKIECEDQEGNQLTDDQTMQRYQQSKEKFLNYFGNHLRLNLSKKVKVDEENEQSIQYLIGDMLKRNFKLISSYHQEAKKITMKLEKIRQKNNQSIHKVYQQKNIGEKQNILKDNFVKNPTKISYDQLIHIKLLHRKDNCQTKQKQNMMEEEVRNYYKDPVFLWKK